MASEKQTDVRTVAPKARGSDPAKLLFVDYRTVSCGFNFISTLLLSSGLPTKPPTPTQSKLNINAVWVSKLNLYTLI